MEGQSAVSQSTASYFDKWTRNMNTLLSTLSPSMFCTLYSHCPAPAFSLWTLTKYGEAFSWSGPAVFKYFSSQRWWQNAGHALPYLQSPLARQWLCTHSSDELQMNTREFCSKDACHRSMEERLPSGNPIWYEEVNAHGPRWSLLMSGCCCC